MTTPDPPTRAALLTRLPAAGFVPPDVAAPWSLVARSAAFAAAVEAFAAAYWSLPPDERRGRYNQLWEVRLGAAAGRLGLLEPGLDVIHTPADAPAPSSHQLVHELEAIRRHTVVQLDVMQAMTFTSDGSVYTTPPATTEPPRPQTTGVPVAAWEFQCDSASVAAGVEAFRAAVAESEAEARRTRFAQRLQLTANWAIGGVTLVVIGLGTVAVVFVTLCGCLGGLLR